MSSLTKVTREQQGGPKKYSVVGKYAMQVVLTDNGEPSVRSESMDSLGSLCIWPWCRFLAARSALAGFTSRSPTEGLILTSDCTPTYRGLDHHTMRDRLRSQISKFDIPEMCQDDWVENWLE
jgi:hypothetical protein